LRPAFDEHDRAELTRKIATADVPRLDRLNPALPRDLVTVVHKAIAHEPADRYQSAGALAEDLRRFLDDRSIAARRVSLPERAWRWCRRNPAMAWLLAALLALFVVAIGSGVWYLQQEAERQGRAREAIDAALEQLPGLRRQGRWTEARAVLAQAKSRLGDAGAGELGRRLEQAEAEVELAAELVRIRLTPAMIEGKLDYPGMAAEYEHTFTQARLAVTGDAQTVADRIGESDLRGELVMALDHWAYVADALKDGVLRARLLELARRADPDPEWGDRFRDPEVWDDPAALRRLAVEAQKRLSGEGADKGLPLPLLALLAKKLGQQDDQAEPLLRAAQRLDPQDFWLCYSLGEALRERKPAEAVGFYRAALAIRPTVAVVYGELAMALIRLEQYDEALPESRRAVQLDPQLNLAYHLIGMCLQGKRQWDDAIAQYRHTLERFPKYAVSRQNLGMCLIEKGRLDEALAELRLAVAGQPTSARAHHQLGRCLEDLGRWDEAMTAYRRAIALDPTGAPAHNQLGMCLHVRGYWDEAIPHYRRAAILDPAASNPPFQLGLVERGRGRHAEALVEFTKSAQADPRSAQVAIAVADTLLRLGRFAEAHTAARRGLDQSPASDSYRPRLQQTFDLCERLLVLDAQLPALFQRKLPPGDSAAQLQRIHLWFTYGRPYAAARLYAALFAAQPALADELEIGYRTHAASAAVRAAVEKGTGQMWLDESERAELRRRALDWLQADLALRAKWLKAGKFPGWSLTRCRTDLAYAGVRDPAALDRLPAAERKEWQRFWADVAELLAADPWEQGKGHAAHRDWPKAADVYARAAKPDATDNSDLWFECAAVLLLSGDREGYAKVYTHMVERCDKAPAMRAYHVARARTLAPAPAADVTRAEELARKELKDSAGEFWSLTEQAALHIRAGRFAKAVPLLERSLRADGKYGRTVLNWLWLAIAHERLGDGAEARRRLAEAQAWLDRLAGAMPDRAEDELGLHLHNWLEAHILRREAEALLGAGSDTPK
jgi:serine/threonine-protein kinase